MTLALSRTTYRSGATIATDRGRCATVLADDHVVVRRGLISVLTPEPDFLVVAEADDGAAAVARAAEVEPDVALLDISMPVLDGIQATRQILAARVPRNALTERYIAEGVKMDEHPEIAFRGGALGRRAILAGSRLDVWQVIETVRTSGNSVQDAAEYLGLPPSRVQAAVNYYAVYRAEVDEIATRERAVSERAEATWRTGQELLA